MFSFKLPRQGTRSQYRRNPLIARPCTFRNNKSDTPGVGKASGLVRDVERDPAVAVPVLPRDSFHIWQVLVRLGNTYAEAGIIWKRLLGILW